VWLWFGVCFAREWVVLALCVRYELCRYGYSMGCVDVFNVWVVYVWFMYGLCMCG
jgi:hypothetical protein